MLTIDTVIISESADGLHILLMSFIHIGTKGNTVNVDKTKIMVFSKGPTPKNVFYFHDEVIESVKEYKYLGIIFFRSESFCKATPLPIYVKKLKKPCRL